MVGLSDVSVWLSSADLPSAGFWSVFLHSSYFVFLNYESPMQDFSGGRGSIQICQAKEALSHFKQSNTVWYYQQNVLQVSGVKVVYAEKLLSVCYYYVTGSLLDADVKFYLSYFMCCSVIYSTVQQCIIIYIKLWPVLFVKKKKKEKKKKTKQNKLII